METLTVKTTSRAQFVDITERVREAIGRRSVKDGIAVVHVPHTTAGITINEAADPAVVEDILSSLAGLVPYRSGYRHSEGNSDAHIKSSLMGSSVTVIVSQGAPVLGTWQGIFFCEFDGPRTRKVLVEVIAR
jgi:secondary thiamine-phosphate synthase enzyme